MGMKRKSFRIVTAFWIFGVCNNFAYVVMLGAAKDILNKEKEQNGTVSDDCMPTIDHRVCSPTSTGLVLIFNILPSVTIKLLAPMFLHKIPYGVRTFFVCTMTAVGLVVTACASTVPLALAGVAIVSLSSGFGEISCLALTSHYSKPTVGTFSSGTGMAGLAGSFSYAALTDPRLLALTPKQSILSMLVVPAIYALTYYVMLTPVDTVAKVSIMKPSQWINTKAEAVGSTDSRSTIVDKQTMELSGSKCGRDSMDTVTELPPMWKIVLNLMRYMIPLFAVYFSEYLINQGLLELTVFDCGHGFGAGAVAQYRWFQVLYQVGTFVSRSSINLVEFNYFAIVAMPLLQVVNMVLLLFNAIYGFLPHYAIVAAIVLYEGLLGGGAYVNAFNHIHKKTDPRVREFALATCSVADSIGILAAAFLSTPVHNAICAMPFYE